MEDKKTSPAINRRTVVAGAAWAVPAIAVATSAPAMVVSPTVEYDTDGIVCKLPGNSGALREGYVFAMTFTNRANESVVLTPLQGGSSVMFDKDGVTAPGTIAFFGSRPVGQLPPQLESITLAPGATATYYLVLHGHGNSQNGSGRACAAFHIRGVTTGREADDQHCFNFNAAPPCK